MVIKRHCFVWLPLPFAVVVLAGAVVEAGAQQPPKPAAKAVAASAPKHDSGSAQANVDAAAKLLASGKIEPAISALSGVISGGNLPAGVMARALYLRGTAYRQQSKPALAISDLTSALWLSGGLNETDRADATQQRAAAYSEAGLTDQGQAISAGSAASRKHATAAAASAVAAPAPANGGFLASLFGGNATSASTATAPPPAQPAASAAKVVPQASSQIATAPPPLTTTIAVAHVPSSPVVARPAKQAPPDGQFVSRVALVRTKAEADAVVAKLKVQYTAAVGDKSTDVAEASFGNMGSFYQVRVGPFASSGEAQALCGKLKGSGLDCVPVTR